MVLFAIALAPIIVILFWFYYKDKFEKEPLGFIFKAFLAGCFSIVPAIILETLWEMKGFRESSDNLYLAFYAFVVVGFSEEFSKYIFVRRIMRHEFVNEPYDGILYSVVVSLGFAFVENVMYVMQGGMGVGLLRAFTAVPAHATFGAVMGFFMGNAKFRGKYIMNTLLGVGGAVVLHGSYDFFLMIQNNQLIRIGALVSLMIGIKLSRMAIRIHNDQSPFNHS